MADIERNEESRRVELYFNDLGSETSEISLVNVFTNMGKRKGFFLRLIALFAVIGLMLPMFKAETSQKRPNAQAAVNILYKMNEEFSFPSFVLQNAIDNTKLKTNISITQIEDNLTIERLLTSKVRQRLEVLKAQIKANGTSVSQATNIDLKYENTYIITLKNGFGGSGLSSTEIADLLNNIIDGYGNYLYRTYADYVLPETNLESVVDTNLDYIENLDTIRSVLDTFKTYCDEKSELYPNYRGADSGMSLKDLSDTISTISDVDINYLYSYVMLNGISKDPSSLLNKFNYTLRNDRLALAEITSNIESNKNTIDEYRNEKIAVSGSEDQSSQSTQVTTEYYNSLVVNQIALYEEQAKLEQAIADLESKIDIFSQAQSISELNYVESEFQKVYADAIKLKDMVMDYAGELMESDAIKAEYLSSTAAQTKSSSFFNSSNIKKAVIGCVAGAVIGCGIWFISGFAEEMKRGGRKDA